MIKKHYVIYDKKGTIIGFDEGDKKPKNSIEVSREEKIAVGVKQAFYEVDVKNKKVVEKKKTKSIEELKEEKLGLLKSIAGKVIDEKYPVFKQMNSVLGVYPERKTAETRNYISKVRAFVDVVEDYIGEASAKDLKDFTIDYEDFKRRIEND